MVFKLKVYYTCGLSRVLMLRVHSIPEGPSTIDCQKLEYESGTINAVLPSAEGIRGQSKANFLASTVDSKKLKHACGVNYADVPSFFCVGIRGRSYSNFLDQTPYREGPKYPHCRDIGHEVRIQDPFKAPVCAKRYLYTMQLHGAYGQGTLSQLGSGCKISRDPRLLEGLWAPCLGLRASMAVVAAKGPSTQIECTCQPPYSRALGHATYYLSLSMYLSVCLSIYLSIHLFIFRSVHLSTYLSTYLPI